MLSDRLPLLITGIAGVGGYNAFHFFKNLFPGQVFGLRPVVNWRLNEEGALTCDLESHSRLFELFEQFQFRSVLHCGGSCALKSCELDPVMANRVNVLAVDSLLSAIERAAPRADAIRLVFLSIDLVFSGAKGGGYVESDQPDPVTIYGKTMVHGENMVRHRRPDAAILRISLPMGVSFNGHAGAIDWIASRFKKGFPATLYYDEVRTPTYTDCLNKVFLHFLDGQQSGIYHAGGPRCLTLYEIAQIVNRVGGYSSRLLKGCYRLQAGEVPPRAGNVSMDSSKLDREMGGQPFLAWPRENSFCPSDRSWHHKRTFVAEENRNSGSGPQLIEPDPVASYLYSPGNLETVSNSIGK